MKDSEIYAIVLGQVIAAARGTAGLSQRALAEQVGMQQSTLSRVETGRLDLSPFFLKRVAEETGHTTANLQQRVDAVFARTQAALSYLLPSESASGWEHALPGMVAFLIAAEA